LFPFRAGGIWEIPAYTRAATEPRPAADPAALTAAVDLVASAKPPVLIAGGTILSGAGSAVDDLCERFGIPILTTPAAGRWPRQNRSFAD
jgi:thiamine pyrophosphate-dependent acetolactate synthase large subunit-like protein